MMETLQLETQPFAVLCAVQLPDATEESVSESLDELARLAKTLGLEAAGRLVQKRSSLDPSACFGPGKINEIKELIEQIQTTDPERPVVLLVDHEMSPSQARNLAAGVDADVLDRTSVILEIFQRHASSRAAKAQVEIVRLAYMAPRLRAARKGKGERQQGGVGGKGSGESGMETDRRKVRDRIAELRAELVRIESERNVQRSRRKDLRRVALVGYTNAGKSTLMRALTGSEIYVADKLFATLDTTVRALQPETEPRVLVSDTVGFIRKLPHDLVASFKSTLDEALEASLLLHVVDASDPAHERQMQTTNEVLAEIGASGIPMRIVMNKTDRIEDEAERVALKERHPDALHLSAKSPDDVAQLRQVIVDFFDGVREEAWVTIGHERGDVRASLLASCELLEEHYDEVGGRYRVLAPEQTLERLRAMLA